MAQSGSFSDVLRQLRAGEQDAAVKVFQRFASRLIALARRRLDSQVRRKVDPEDIVQSVYRSFFRRQAAGEFDLAGWDDLWGLLATSAVWKCHKHGRNLRRAVRDIRREQSLTPPFDDAGAFVEAFSREPTPEEAAMLVETVEELMRGLDERDQTIVSLRLQEYQEREISEQVGCSERTVRRTLHHARQRLQTTQDETRNAPS